MDGPTWYFYLVVLLHVPVGYGASRAVAEREGDQELRALLQINTADLYVFICIYVISYFMSHESQKAVSRLTITELYYSIRGLILHITVNKFKSC